MTDYVTVGPCETDGITIASMTQFAQQVDTGFATVNSVIPALLQRDYVEAFANAPTFSAGVTNTFTWTANSGRNPNGMWVAGSPTVFTLQSNGTFAITVYLLSPNVGTFTSFRMAYLLAGAEFAWQKWPTSGSQNATYSFQGVTPSATAGQQITVTGLATGSGSGNPIVTNLHIMKISDS